MELPDYSVMARLHQGGRPSQVALDPLPSVSTALPSRSNVGVRMSTFDRGRWVEGRIRRFLKPASVELKGKRSGDPKPRRKWRTGWD